MVLSQSHCTDIRQTWDITQCQCALVSSHSLPPHSTLYLLSTETCTESHSTPPQRSRIAMCLWKQKDILLLLHALIVVSPRRAVRGDCSTLSDTSHNPVCPSSIFTSSTRNSIVLMSCQRPRPLFSKIWDIPHIRLSFEYLHTYPLSFHTLIRAIIVPEAHCAQKFHSTPTHGTESVCPSRTLSQSESCFWTSPFGLQFKTELTIEYEMQKVESLGRLRSQKRITQEVQERNRQTEKWSEMKNRSSCVCGEEKVQASVQTEEMIKSTANVLSSGNTSLIICISPFCSLGEVTFFSSAVPFHGISALLELTRAQMHVFSHWQWNSSEMKTLFLERLHSVPWSFHPTIESCAG